jgi:hypothetical protein
MSASKVSKPIRCLDTFWVLLRAFLCFHDLVLQGIEERGKLLWKRHNGSEDCIERSAYEDHPRAYYRVVIKEGELVEIVFDDHSTMRVKVVGGPTLNVLREGKIKSVRQEGSNFTSIAKMVRLPHYDWPSPALRLASRIRQAGSNIRGDGIRCRPIAIPNGDGNSSRKVMRKYFH